MGRRFFRVIAIDYDYGYYVCADSCGNQFRLFPDQDLDEKWIGGKVSVEEGMVPSYIVKDIRFEPRLR